LSDKGTTILKVTEPWMHVRQGSWLYLWVSSSIMIWLKVCFRLAVV